MSNHNTIRQLLAQVSGHDRILTVPKLYIELTGNLVESVLLNQIVFYSDKSKRKDGFFYKRYEDWQEETCLTERQVRNAAKKLVAKGLIETKVMRANGSPTVHYRLISDKLVGWIMTKGKEQDLQKVRNNADNTAESLTYDYTDDNTYEKKPSVSDDNKTIKEQNEESFEEWWNLYGLKKDRKKCLAKYIRLLKDFSHLQMMTGTEAYLKYLQNLKAKGEFVPQQRNPLTFLNGENFNDEYESQNPLQANNSPKPFTLDFSQGEDD